MGPFSNAAAKRAGSDRTMTDASEIGGRGDGSVAAAGSVGAVSVGGASVAEHPAAATQRATTPQNAFRREWFLMI
jgi:hypothetical protein